MFSPEFLAATRNFRFGTTTDELFRSNFAAVGGWVLTDTPGGRDELRGIVDPVLHDMVETIEPHDEAAHWFAGAGTGIVETVGVHVFGFRIRDRGGRLAGTAMINKPAASMTDARHDHVDGRPASLRADATGREGRAAPGGDPVRRPRGVLAARAAAVDRQLLRARAAAGPRRRPVRDRRGRSRRPPRRRRRRRVLPRRDHRVGVGRRARLHHRRPRAASGASPTSPRAAICEPRGRRPALRPALGLDALRRAASRPPGAPRSPRSATRSTRPRASRPAPPADARSRPRT